MRERERERGTHMYTRISMERPPRGGRGHEVTRREREVREGGVEVEVAGGKKKGEKKGSTPHSLIPCSLCPRRAPTHARVAQPHDSANNLRHSL